jgi:signal peptidase I
LKKKKKIMPFLAFEKRGVTKIMTIILALELAHSFGWFPIWVESDSMLALGAFDNSSIVP